MAGVTGEDLAPHVTVDRIFPGCLCDRHRCRFRRGHDNFPGFRRPDNERRRVFAGRAWTATPPGALHLRLGEEARDVIILVQALQNATRRLDDDGYGGDISPL